MRWSIFVDESRRFSPQPYTARVPCGPDRKGDARNDYKRPASPACLRVSISPRAACSASAYRRHRSWVLDFLKTIDAPFLRPRYPSRYWITTAPTRPPWVRHLATERPRYHIALHPHPWPHGSTRSSAGSLYLPSGRSSAAHTEVFRNWKPRSKVHCHPYSSPNLFRWTKSADLIWHPARFATATLALTLPTFNSRNQ